MPACVKRIVVLTVIFLVAGCGTAGPTATPVAPALRAEPTRQSSSQALSTSQAQSSSQAQDKADTPVLPTATSVPPTDTPLPLPSAAPAPPATWTRPADGMVMLYVPGGEFDMGSSEAEIEAARVQCEAVGNRAHCERRSYNESPMHAVALAGFWLDRTEVTNAQYALCVEEGACRPSRLAHNASYNGDDYPVAGIPWQDAADYCAWAGGRLPSEAEWEYAARGSERRIYPWGDAFDCAGGNFEDDFTGCDDGYAHTAPVGSFPAGVSWCGALDLAGNVWEWVADWYGDYSSAPGANPSGPTTGDLNVLRGGSWGYDQDGVRAAYRYPVPPDANYLGVGLRCAASAPMQALPGPAQRDTLYLINQVPLWLLKGRQRVYSYI